MDPLIRSPGSPGSIQSKSFFSKCWDGAAQKISSIWRSNSSLQNQEKSLIEVPLLQEQVQPSCSSRCIDRIGKVSSAVLRFLDRRSVLTTISVANIAGIAVSASFLTPVFIDFCNTCISVISGFSGDKIGCQAPYEERIIAYEATIGACAGILGIIFQRVLDSIVLTDSQQGLSYFSRFKQQCKIITSHVQTNYSYEINLALGYLYNEGFWLDPTNPNAWIVYYECQAAAIGIASAFLGMYLRLQWVAIKTSFSGNVANTSNLKLFSLKNRRGIIVYGSFSTALTTMAFLRFSPDIRLILKELSLFFLAKPIGRITITLLKRRENLTEKPSSKKHLSLVLTIARIIPAWIAALGYYGYFTSSSERGKLCGLVAIGFATGIKDVYYQAPKKIVKEIQAIPNESPCPVIVNKVGRFVKEYWRTGALIVFATTSAELGYLSCYNRAEYICPFGFQLSSNYIEMDGTGVNIAIAAGLVQYYARKLFRHLSEKNENTATQVLRWYIDFTDKYQFDLIVSIPWTIVKSGLYSSDTYTAFNPPAVLIPLGFTFGTFKENVDSDMTDNYRPVFTDTAVITNTMVGLI